MVIIPKYMFIFKNDYIIIIVFYHFGFMFC